MKRLIATCALLVGGCTLSTDVVPGPPAQLTRLPRELTADEVRVSQAANQFAFSLFRRLSDALPDSNVFVSPFSVTMSLGMTMNGANGTTLEQMRSTLGFGASELAEINAGYRGLMSLESGLDPSTTFTIANSVWYRAGYPVHQSFLDVVKATFDAEVKASPFDAATVGQVNEWVSANTRGKIPTILDAVSPNDVMFLINAIYFKGSWRDRFDPANTRDGTFQTIEGTPQTVKMMYRPDGAGKVSLGWSDVGEMGELTYGNGAFVMTVVLPRNGTDVNAAVAALDTASWRVAVEAMRETQADVQFPKLKLAWGRDLVTDLRAMGMVVPFQGGMADFTRMSPGGRNLFIAFVKHKTYVDVNEEGTEAAAVTATGIRVVSMAPGFRVNRPFVFAIRERFSGTILFIGKIVRVEQ